MAYEIPASVDFAFVGDTYEPLTDFSLSEREIRCCSTAFTGPVYQGNWQTATDRQQVCTTAYSTSRPINTSQTQTSQQAQPLAAGTLVLYWGSVAKKETVVRFHHGQSRKKEKITGDQWQQIASKDSRKKAEWDQSIRALNESNKEAWNRPAERDLLHQSLFRRVDEFSPPHQTDKIGYLLTGSELT